MAAKQGNSNTAFQFTPDPGDLKIGDQPDISGTMRCMVTRLIAIEAGGKTTWINPTLIESLRPQTKDVVITMASGTAYTIRDNEPAMLAGYLRTERGLIVATDEE